MKLIALECPKCGAELEVGGQLTHCICNYCGSHFIIDDEARKADVRIRNPRRLGYEFGRGRMGARSSGGNMELAEEVRALIEPLCSLTAFSKRAKALKAEIGSLEKQVAFANTEVGRLVPFFVFAGMILLGIIAAADGGRGSLAGNIQAGAAGGLVFSALILLVRHSSVYTLKAKRQRLESLEGEIGARQRELGKHDTNIIPPDYRSRQAMEFIYSALANQRAMTMQEAVNLYEDELKSSRSEQLQREQLRQLQEINAVGRANAAANMINALNTGDINRRLRK